MSKKPAGKKERIAQEEQYIEFLTKRLNSDNYKKNVSAEEYEKTKEKLKKSTFLLRTLKK